MSSYRDGSEITECWEPAPLIDANVSIEGIIEERELSDNHPNVLPEVFPKDKLKVSSFVGISPSSSSSSTSGSLSNKRKGRKGQQDSSSSSPPSFTSSSSSSFPTSQHPVENGKGGPNTFTLPKGNELKGRRSDWRWAEYYAVTTVFGSWVLFVSMVTSLLTGQYTWSDFIPHGSSAIENVGRVLMDQEEETGDMLMETVSSGLSRVPLTDPDTIVENGRPTLVIAAVMIGPMIPWLMGKNRMKNHQQAGAAAQKYLPTPNSFLYRLSYTNFNIYEAFLIAIWFAITVSYINSQSWALILGNLAVANGALASLPATRASSPLQMAFGMPPERAYKFHRWIGRGVWLTTTGHFLGYVYRWYGAGTLSDNLFGDIKYIYGEVGWAAITILFITSYSRFRRKNFELFYYSHFLFIGFWVFGALHSPPCWLFWGPSIALWVWDRLSRKKKNAPAQVLDAQIVGRDTMKLILMYPGINAVNWESGQYVYICLPDISGMQWHPFTISSAPGSVHVGEGKAGRGLPMDAFTVHVKFLGDWTSSLGQVMHDLRLQVDGPYGKTAYDPHNYDTTVLISGGIGVTPMISILEDIYIRHQSRNPRGEFSAVRRCYFIWIIQTEESYHWFSRVLHEISKSKQRRYFDFTIYLTQMDTKVKSGAFRMGRPNFDDIFNSLVKLHFRENRVGVFACGPERMVSSVWDKCTVYSNHNNAATRFDFHAETFEY